MTSLVDIVAALRAHRSAARARWMQAVRGMHAQVPIGDPDEDEGGYDDDDDEDDEDEDPDEEDERWELRLERGSRGPFR